MSKNVMLTVMIPVAVCMIIIDIARLRDWRLWHVFRRLISPIIRETEERGDFTGATYILTTACVVIAFFSRPVASLALAFIIVGDPAAALIGQRFGKRRFRNKSLEGSLAFLTAALIITIIAPQLPLAVRVVGAFVATVTEAVSFKVDDNTTVPLVSGLIMTLLLRLLP
jgi:dolichol kinase